MSDVDEDNFDRAFDLLRPGRWYCTSREHYLMLQCLSVIQGTADVGKTLVEDELQVIAADSLQPGQI